jgi:hypothetical protein
MSLLFLNGLMPERHECFIRTLSRSHTLAATRWGKLAGDPALDVIDYMDDSRLQGSPELAALPALVVAQMRVLADSLAADLGANPLAPRADQPLTPAEINDLVRPRVERLLLEQLRFRRFAQEHQVGMVISGSDFSSHSRIIARTARALGIPTLDVEHGFFFSRLAGDWCRTRGRMPLMFTSEYVNLDNALEVELLGHEQDLFLPRDPDRRVTFLGLGTPIDTVAHQSLPREQALAALGLDPSRLQVLLGGSWIEARSVQKLLGAQVDVMDLYVDLFRSLAESELRHRMQLTIKLHPADTRPDVLPGVTAAITRLAADCGLPCPLILSDRLAEAMSACDLLMATSFSSVLYDAFMMGKPSLVVFPRYLVFSDDDRWRTECTLPLQAGVCEAAVDGADAWRRAGAWLDPARRERFVRDREAFSRRYGLIDRPVQEKCEAIAAWIATQLVARPGA